MSKQFKQNNSCPGVWEAGAALLRSPPALSATAQQAPEMDLKVDLAAFAAP